MVDEPLEPMTICGSALDTGSYILPITEQIRAAVECADIRKSELSSRCFRIATIPDCMDASGLVLTRSIMLLQMDVVGVGMLVLQL